MGKIKNFLKGNKSSIMFGLFILGMQLFISLFTMVMAGGENQWVNLLSLLMPISFFVIIFMMGKSYAVKDYQSKKNNAARQNNKEQVAEYKIYSEYALYKPFLSAFVAFLPTFLLFIIYAITRIMGVRAAILILNLAYFIPITNFFEVQSVAIVLIGVAIASAAAVAGYVVQGRMLDIQYQEIELRRQNRQGGK